MLVLERANHLHKADTRGRIYQAHLEGRIDAGMLERLVAAKIDIDIQNCLCSQTFTAQFLLNQ